MKKQLQRLTKIAIMLFVFAMMQPQLKAQTPVINPITNTVCSGVQFTVTPIDVVNGIVPLGTTDSWSVPTGSGFAGGGTGSGSTNISGTLINNTNVVKTATYTVTPTSGGNTGAPFTVTVTINPTPSIISMVKTVCSGDLFTVKPLNTINGIVPTGTILSWAEPTATNITGGAAGSGSSVSGTLMNTSNTTKIATYTVTPTANTCVGSTFTVQVTINPTAVITSMNATPNPVSSGAVFTAYPINNTNGIVPIATTYSWQIPVGTGLTGGATASNAVTISGTLINTTNTQQTATYTVTPKSSGCIGIPFTVTAIINPATPASNAPIGSILKIGADSTISYWNDTAWITVAPGLQGQILRFTNGVPAWIDPPVTDYDGNVYDVVTIGSQRWLKQNLNVTHYRNGDAIQNVTNNSAWVNLTTGAYCNYYNDESYSTTYGRLYNWYTVVDSRNLCPTGWHVPSHEELTTLTTYLGGSSIAGNNLREVGTSHWCSPNWGATNESGFTALPAGLRSDYDGAYSCMTLFGWWWSSTDSNNDAWDLTLHFNTNDAVSDGNHKGDGFSVRCIKD